MEPTQPGLPEDIFPERGGKKYAPTLAKILLMGEGREHVLKQKCEKNVAKSVENGETTFKEEIIAYWNCI